MCFATAAWTIYPRTCCHIVQKMVHITSNAVVLEPVFVDVSQGQKSAWGKVLGSLIPTDLAPLAAFQTWAQKRVRVQFLGTTIPLTPLIASRDCYSVLNWPFFSLMILISCKKKVFRSVHSKCLWASNEQAYRGTSHSKLLSQKFFSAKQTANSSERVETHDILVPFSCVPLPLHKVHPDESDYQFRQQENKQCLSEVIMQVLVSRWCLKCK